MGIFLLKNGDKWGFLKNPVNFRKITWNFFFFSKHHSYHSRCILLDFIVYKKAFS